ncbi:MAG TPA: chorismate mutase [Gemmatimonadaceae bacterium]|nr:chorismate mutase [Gemmatimonadaceae bacterium]
MSHAGHGPTRIRGVRGATRVARDDSESIRAATRELLTEMMLLNSLSQDAIVSAFFTVTPDLVSEFPARAARELGWDDVAMLCSTEIPVPGSMSRVVRVLLLAELPPNTSVRHVYLNGAEELRPDL